MNVPGVMLGMDPAVVLAEALERAVWPMDGEAEDGEAEDGDAVRLEKLVISMSRWLTRGGFRPGAWEGLRV